MSGKITSIKEFVFLKKSFSSSLIQSDSVSLILPDSVCGAKNRPVFSVSPATLSLRLELLLDPIELACEDLLHGPRQLLDEGVQVLCRVGQILVLPAQVLEALRDLGVFFNGIQVDRAQGADLLPKLSRPLAAGGDGDVLLQLQSVLVGCFYASYFTE